MSEKAANGTAAEPIAIIGMACRYPGGVASPEGLWDFLTAGSEAFTDFPTDRGWDLERLRADPARAGSSLLHRGGFLDAAEFDAAFFSVSPREALAMHPEQRILLEVSWEACERAMLDPQSLAGSNTGVFAARLSTEYGPPLHLAPEGASGLMLTGNTPSALSGRIGYTLGVVGPAITIDTASSGSLVAIHLAVQSLRAWECDLALAGGISTMPAPGHFTEFTKQQGLAPDGRPKPFSADADGTVWSEGAGMLLLARLSEARAAGHPVLAVIRGSAVNSDGATEGLAVPSAPAQERLIVRALANAGLSPAEVDAVEAHGSGTRAGDRAEALALTATYGAGRPAERPLLVGSVKSNIGHAQAAAGVAGVIKTVMALRHGVLPGLVHLDTPSPHVDWAGSGVLPLAEAVAWPRGERVRRCGVSSFGIAGTNAHLIVEEAPEPAAPASDGGSAVEGVLPWVVSARAEEALRGQARALLAVAAEERPEDIGLSLAQTRSGFDERAVVLGSGREELLAGLAALARGESAPSVVRGRAWAQARPVFVFPGQGGQWVGMATELAASSPVFARSLAECGEALGRYVPWSLREVLDGAPGAPGLDRVDVVQPVLWAVMVSLAQVWRSYGVEPAAVVGHSQGEIAAAVVAGALSLDDGARVVARRSQMLVPLAGGGAMMSLGLGAAKARARVARWAGRVEVAAINGPESVTVSGEPAAVEELRAECEAAGIRARVVNVDYASHSRGVDPVRDELLEALRTVRPQLGTVPMISTVTGKPVDHEELDADYWWQNLRQPVEFEAASRHLLAAGHHVFVEVSPHPVMAFGLEGTIEEAGVGAAVIGTLRRDDGGPLRLATSLAQAHVHGVPVDWSGYFAPAAPRRVTLPTYAFQRRRYWLDTPGLGAADGALAVAVAPQPQEPASASRDPRELLAGEVAAVLGLAGSGQVAADLSFKALGFESMTGVELRNRLIAATGLRLPTTLIYDYPSPRELADYLVSVLGSPEADETTEADLGEAQVPAARVERALDEMDRDELVRLALGRN
ncbi:type I polyketide synthase [Kitasatospora viridis]|uniref:type I polyketide synthase n=1 Tax=Kitasatospora viridis TaxID=281105 RepID=UPI001BABA12F|nr:type I polyketide synthase [Kitasatospora viridis]